MGPQCCTVCKSGGRQGHNVVPFAILVADRAKVLYCFATLAADGARVLWQLWQPMGPECCSVRNSGDQ